MKNTLANFIVFFVYISCASICYASNEIENIELCDGLKQIERITFVTDINLGAEDLSTHFPFKLHEVCDKEKLKQSIKVLELRNIFEKIDLAISEGNNKLTIEYKLIPFLVLSQVQFYGNFEILSSELLRVSALKIGNNIFSEDVRESERRIKSLYYDNGYTDVQLESNLIADRTSPLVSLEYRIEEGEVNRVSKIEFEGLDDAVFDSVEQNVQNTFKGNPLKKGISNDIKKYTYQLLSSKGYALSSVLIDTLDKLNGIYLIKVNPKERFQITWEGLHAFSESALLSRLDLERRTAPLRHGAILNWCEDIKSKYVSEGYIDALVECEDGDLSHVHIKIEEGIRYKSFRARFNGNDAISRRQLMDSIKLAAGYDSFSLLGNQFIFSEINKNLFETAVKSLYVSKGYLDVEVSAHFKRDPAKSRATMEVQIKENKLYEVKDLVITFNEKADDLIRERAQSYLNTFKNKPYHVDTIASTILTVEEDFLQRGYANASLYPEYNKNSEILSVDVKVLEPITVRNILISGNYFTVDKIILRELPFNEGDNINEYFLEKSRISLLGLGIFKSVELFTSTDGVPEGQCDVQIVVREREAGVAEALTELSTQDGLHVQGQVGQRNLFGTGKALIFSVDGYFKNNGVSNFDAARARAAYGSPKIFGSKMDYQLEGFLQSNLNLNRTFKYDRAGATNSLKFPFLEVFRFTSSHTFYTERLFDVDQDLIINNRDTGSSVYSVLRANLEYDQRDDPFVATKGYRVELGGGLFTEALGSDVPMYEAHSQFTDILPISTFWTYAMNLRGGMLRVMEDNNTVPLGSRYFIGGRDTLRGYTRYQVGPRSDEGRVVGGDTMVTFNQEVRYQFNDQMRGFLFLDVGQSFLVEDSNFTGDTKDSIKDFRISPGFGTQYLTPIGPLGFEVGFATDREFGERWGRILLSIGTAF